jgi:hypothetical protein
MPPRHLLTLERINSTPERFPIHQPMPFHVRTFCEQEDDQTALLILLRPRVARARRSTRPHNSRHRRWRVFPDSFLMTVDMSRQTEGIYSCAVFHST